MRLYRKRRREGMRYVRIHVRKKWGKQFCLKGIMSIADAKRAVDIGATAIMVSNHGGRQLDGSRSPRPKRAEATLSRRSLFDVDILW